MYYNNRWMGPVDGPFHLCQLAYLAAEAALAGAEAAVFLATFAFFAFFANLAVRASALVLLTCAWTGGWAVLTATGADAVATGEAAIAEIAKAVAISAISFFIYFLVLNVY